MIKKFKSDKNTEFEISFDVNDNKFITQTKTTELYLIKNMKMFLILNIFHNFKCLQIMKTWKKFLMN
jgi:hypothetical protein